MKLQVASGRVNYQPTFPYQDGVLIGPNWYEERQKYVNTTHKHTSTNSNVHVDQGPIVVDPNIFWNHKIPGEGFDPRLVMDHEGVKYHENYSTTSDLSFNHLPKQKPNKIRQYNTMRHRFMPEEDLTHNFGNTKQWGLKEKKRNQWKYDIESTKCTWDTEISENFQPYKKEDYCVSRKATSKAISAKHYSINVKYHLMPLRQKQILIVPDIPYKLIPRPYPHFYF